MMDMKSRNQYLEELIRKNGGYHLKSKKNKSKILDEYCRVTGQNRKYTIRKLRSGSWVYQERKKIIKRQRKKKVTYDNTVKYSLIKCWQIFDQPCGQRLAPLLKQETSRLLKYGELSCSAEIVNKLKQISARTIDTLLKPHKEKSRNKRIYDYKNNPLLYEKIPTKFSFDWDRNMTGNIQIDFVEHCGRYNYGEFVHTLSTTDIATGWWEGSAQLSRGMNTTVANLNKIRHRYPFPWRSVHTDNDSAFINWQLKEYADKENLKFSRSRPYHKNDNCWVEQKNGTHVRRCIGHLRYDTNQELFLLNSLYSNEFRLYKNFFQPVIKLVSKERIGGHVKRKYDKPLTPYQRIICDKAISKDVKNKLNELYESLNPAQLKREIDKKLITLKAMYDDKIQHPKVEKTTKSNPATVTFLNCTTNPVRLPNYIA